MHWNGAIKLLLALLIAQSAIAQESEEPESTTIIEDSTDRPSSRDRQKELDSTLRSALLKALTDLENDENREAARAENTNSEDVERAQASAVTIVEDGKGSPSISSSEDQSEDFPKGKAEIVVFQKSDAIQGRPITSIEQNPLDPLKDAEQIITSASNSFDGHQNEARSVFNIIEPKDKYASYSNLNTISDNESEKTYKTSTLEKFSIGKDLDQEEFVKNLDIKPYLGFNGDVKNSEDDLKNEIKENNNEDSEAITEVPIQVSTEESEAKVEQVQFFSAPLVAAFTVHQDEKGQPKKVEPIYKNGLNSKKEEPVANIPQASQKILQSSTFNTLELQQKQQILEQELEKLRNQQRNILISGNVDANSQRFSQAISQSFNRFDPVFTEPDRSIVTKLATIDPSNLLTQNSETVLDSFMPPETILPRVNFVQPSANQITLESLPKNNRDVSLVQSISFDPLVEAGKLPENAQVLPNKEPIGFHSFVKLPKLRDQQNFVGSNVFQPSSNFIDPILNRPQQGISVIQSSPSNFLVSEANNNPQIFNNNRFLRQETGTQILPTFNYQLAQNIQIPNQNRFLKQQEQGASNVGFNQNSFSIIPAQELFRPKHELGFFPDNNRFVVQNPPQPNININNQNTRFFRNNIDLKPNVGFQGQNQNTLFRSSHNVGPQKVTVEQSVQPFPAHVQGTRFFRPSQENGLNLEFSPPQNNRILRSNHESALLSVQNRFAQTPLIQNYKYSNSFGFPSIPLH